MVSDSPSAIELELRRTLLRLEELARRAEAAERRFLDFAAIAEGWLWETDAEHRFIAFDYGRDGQIVQRPGGDFVGRTRWEVVGADPADPVWAAHIDDLQARREFRDFEYSVADANWELHHIAISGRPQFDSAGVFLGYRGIATDVTARKAAVLKQQESEAGLRYLFEKNPNPMWIYDRETLRFLAVNDAAIDRYGWARAEFLALTIADIRPPEDVGRVQQAARDRSSAYVRAGEWRHRTKDGSILFVEIESFSLDVGGRAAVLVAARDISERKKAEADLAAAEEKLRQAQKLEAVGQLTGGVAHDFNNLLTVILGNVEILGQQLAENASAQALIDILRRAAERGSDLTHRLLAFARRQALDPKEVDVNGLVARMHGLIRFTLGEDIDVTLVQDPDLWPALVDPAQLETAVLNLAINARDAMARGGKLSIETQNVTLDEGYRVRNPDALAGDYVLVAVSDSGAGMSADVLARAFEPFFTTKEVGKGSGLGLSMVYGFAKQTGGHVKIYSELGHGTIVRLYLPRAVAVAAVPAMPPVVAEDTAGRGESVLVVEDDEMVRDTAIDHLVSLGYRVLHAADGASALVILKSGEPVDLLFTDIVMPGGMNGKELAAHALLLRPRLKVLFTSGYSENTIIHQGRLDPGVNLLSKPYRRRDLATKVRRVLAGQL